VREARVWSRPADSTRLFGAALTAATAAWLSTWADGLLTVGTDLQTAKAAVSAFTTHGEHKPMVAKIDLSWAPSEEQALLQAHQQWRVHALQRERLADLSTPDEFENAGRAVLPEDMRHAVLISADLDQHVEWLRERLALGFEVLNLHNVGTNQVQFIEAFGERVLPALRGLH
jgi:coenzyme F420-dependent glucose-6-phosphate dehydrogenase